MPIHAIVPRIGEEILLNHGDYGWIDAFILDTPADKAVDDGKRPPYIHLLFKHPSDAANLSWRERAVASRCKATFVIHGLGIGQWCYREEREAKKVVMIPTPDKVAPKTTTHSSEPAPVSRDLAVELEEVGQSKRVVAKQIIKLDQGLFLESSKRISEYSGSELKKILAELKDRTPAED